MTRERGVGALGRRLLTAFILVALASVVVLTVAALVGSSRGIAAGQGTERQATADAVAGEVARALGAAGSWAGADLSAAIAIGQAQGADVTVRDLSGAVMGGTAGGMAMGAMNGMGRGGVVADVIVDGVAVGSVRLGFGSTAADRGQTIAWTWILVAAIASLLFALGVAVWTTRWITAPIRRLSTMARSFAGGDRAARPSPEDLASDSELGDLARAFAAAADDVERSEAVRRRLSADVAHELRTPLAVLQAGLEELRDGFVDADPERLAALHEQSVRLGRIVEDLAQLSAAESAGMALRRLPLDLGVVVEDAVAAARPAVAARGMTLESDVAADISVVGDADRLHQVLGNLLANAARYCRTGDRISVRAAADPPWAMVTVADTGPGIPPADLPLVFERLWRGSSTAPSDEAGSGIGLAIVRELVEAHGGDVRADSDGESGTTITLRLPLASAG